MKKGERACVCCVLGQDRTKPLPVCTLLPALPFANKGQGPESYIDYTQALKSDHQLVGQLETVTLYVHGPFL